EPTPPDQPIPAGQPGIIHSASPEIEVQGLAPGAHTVRAVFAYGDHVPFAPALTAEATFNVADRPPPTVKILSPGSGEAGLPGGVRVRRGVAGMALKPAEASRELGPGHLHLLVDRELPPVGEPIPTGVAGVVHTAATEATLPALAPGRHTLTVVLG